MPKSKKEDIKEQPSHTTSTYFHCIQPTNRHVRTSTNYVYIYIYTSALHSIAMTESLPVMYSIAKDFGRLRPDKGMKDTAALTAQSSCPRTRTHVVSRRVPQWPQQSWVANDLYKLFETIQALSRCPLKISKPFLRSVL